jgi:hypothetical protein
VENMFGSVVGISLMLVSLMRVCSYVLMCT